MIKPLTATRRPHVLASVLGKTCRLNRYAPGINAASGFSARQAEVLISWQETHGLTFVFIDEARCGTGTGGCTVSRNSRTWKTGIGFI